MTKTNQKLKWGLILFTYFSMTIFGLFDNMTGPAIPPIVTQYSVAYAMISFLMIVGTLGYLFGTVVGGIATDRFGFRSIFIVGNLLIFATAACMRFADQYYTLVILWFLMRVGFGAYETGCNSLGAKIFIRASAVMMNLMHLFYGLGSIAGTHFIGQILNAARAWHMAYFYAAGTALLGFVLTLIVVFPKSEHVDKSIKKLRGLGYMRDILKDKILWLLILALGFSELIELGIGAWIVNFLEKARGFETVQAAHYLTLFFVFFTIARLIGGWIAEKVGYMRFIIYCAVVAVILFYVAFSVGGSATICFSIAGAPIAMLFPMSMTVLMTYYQDKIATVMGFVIASASIIHMMLNQMIGFLADYISVGISFAIVGMGGVLVVVFTLMAKKKMDIIREEAVV